ncbi:AI-2E family transporter [Candidatus Woesearchaeota archaeon]|nr:AI-2E family transporter [Candidatus Woesearchaeota archaeon]
MSKSSNRKFLYFGSLGIFLYVAYLLLKPFMVAILSSGIIAYIFYPLYQKLFKVLNNQKVAAFLVSTIIILLVTIPSIFLLNSLTKEAYIIYTFGIQNLNVAELTTCDSPSLLCDVKNLFGDLETRYYLEQALDKGTSYILEFFSRLALSLPAILLDLFIILFITYYLFISSATLTEKIYEFLPFNRNHLKLISKNLNDVTYSIIYGVFIVGILEALLAILAFALIGMPSPIFWGLLIGFLAFIPLIGPAAIWVPILLYQLYFGVYWKVWVILIIGVFLSLMDTFLKPIFISGRTDINPALMLLGVLGGINLFGIIGVILGPLILSFFSVLFKIYMQEKIII